MAKCKLTNQKRFKALLLTLILLLVSCAYIFSACGTNDDDDDDENTTKTDTQTFANADFEYFDNNSKSYLIPTANSWSKSSAATRWRIRLLFARQIGHHGYFPRLERCIPAGKKGLRHVQGYR